MTVSINGTSGLTFNDASTQNTAATGFGFKNRIINGAMMIDQRNAGASVSVTSLVYTLDRWSGWCNNGSANATVAQSFTAPAGFVNSLLFTNVTGVTVGSSDRAQLAQNIEGLNIADLGWGTANAQPVTLSFWVRSSLTGTFGGSLANNAADRSYPFSYTISAANTWEQKSITIAGDTSGTWLTTNGVGIRLDFDLGCGSTLKGTAGSWASADYRGATGSVNLTATSGATFYITGVQLEKGSTATSFDYRPYGTELALCQRYFTSSFPIGVAPVDGNPNGEYQINLVASGDPQIIVQFPVMMRTDPAATLYNPSRASPAGQWDRGAALSGSNARAFANSPVRMLIDNTDISLAAGYWGIAWSATAEL